MVMTKESAFKALAENELINGLSEEQARVFFDRGKAVKAKADTVFISEGAPNGYIYMVLSGELEVFLPDTAERFSKVTLAKRLPGHYVGEYSFLDALPASASVKTVGDCILFQIPHAEVENVFRTDHEIGQVIYRNLLTNLVDRLRGSHQELDEIHPFT
jgi:CRP-like cAMP-binding protein